MGRLVETFRLNSEEYAQPTYSEASVRGQFLDHLLKALGWDVDNAAGLSEATREVVLEPPLRQEGRPRRPDYSMRVGPVARFFLEAKKPSVRLDYDPEPALQVRRYGWNARLPFSILTDFQELAVYDTRVQPGAGQGPRYARLEYFTYDRFEEKWDWLAEQFSRDAVHSGSLDRWAAEAPKKSGSTPVDEVFLQQIEGWRAALARSLATANRDLGVLELNEAVQVLLDRIIFLRICEDRGIEPSGELLQASKSSAVYANLQRLFVAADDRYNSGLFHFREERGRSTPRDALTPALDVPNHALKQIIQGLYPPISPFTFQVIGADLLGSVYEQFLGQVIEVSSARSVKVVEKPEVKKAGGVVYTPPAVVRHIIQRTVIPTLDDRSVDSVSGHRTKKPVRVLDPACGSGSFLIEVYQVLLDWHLDQYATEPEKWLRSRPPRIYRYGDAYRLTTAERKRILTTHVFGVDIDPQAVEVTKLSLLLKVLERETSESVSTQLAIFQERALPDLDQNIKCGNSLISTDFADGDLALFQSDRRRKVNMFDWRSEFPAVFAGSTPGFDVVLGNPPYVLLQDEFRDDEQLEYFRQHYGVASYKIDTYHLFIERGIELTKSGGYCSMITPTNYMVNNYLGPLRTLMLDETRLREVAVLAKGVFRHRSVDCAVFVCEPGGRSVDPFDQLTLLPAANESLVQVGVMQLSPDQIRGSTGYLFTGSATAGVSEIWAEMRSQKVTLGSLAAVRFGKQLRDRKSYPEDVLRDLANPTSLRRGYAPCYTGVDSVRWRVTWNGLACRTDRAAKRGGCWDDEVHAARNKLLCRQIGVYPDFSIDEQGYQCLNTMFMIVPHNSVDPWHLLGILNSTPIRALWVDQYWDQRGTFPKVKGSYLKELPVFPPIDDRVARLAKRLVRLAADLGTATQAGERTRIGREIEGLETQLDKAVADGFGLTAAQLSTCREVVAGAVDRGRSVRRHPGAAEEEID